VSAAKLLAQGAAAQTESHDYLYWEFCLNGEASGILPQAYDKGWSQAVRWDTGAGASRKQWKAIRSNDVDGARPGSGNVWLYELTSDISESTNLASAPSSADALKQMAGFMAEAHTEDIYWKSSKNSSDPCCASCFTHGGCGFPCVKAGGAPTPSPPGPSPPIPLADLVGGWSGGSAGNFSLSLGADRTVTIAVVDSPGSCWGSGDGIVAADGHQILNVVCNSDPACKRDATGTVSAKVISKYLPGADEYPYAAGHEYSITWDVKHGDGDYDENGQWPTWKKTVEFDALVPPAIV
jgi:hypothetical protein